MWRLPGQWFRFGGLLIIAVIGVPQIVLLVTTVRTDIARRPELAGPAGPYLPMIWGLLAAGLAAGFAWSFWLATRPRRRVPGWIYLLLVLQVLACLLVSIEFVYVVAAELALALPPRAGRAGILVLIAAVLLLTAAAVADGSFEPADGLQRLPYAAQVVLTPVNIVAWMLFAFAAGRLIIHERDGREELGRVNRELLAAQALLAQSSRQAERVRIARELHDSLGHHLTALAVNLELAQRVEPERAREIAGRSHLIARLLLNDVRDTVASMRRGGDIDVRDAIAALAANLPSPAVHVELAPEARLSDSAEAEAVIRCAQEGLTNAIRHGAAANVWISLSREGDKLRLELRDDGRGAASPVQGNGLRGMQERVEALGGSLSFLTAPGDGFRLSVFLPFRGTA